jgi:hypothetical protein
LFCYGQLNHSYISSQAKWSVAESDSHPPEWTSVYYSVGDTISVNDTVYHKLLESDSSGRYLGFRYLIRKDSTKPAIFRRRGTHGKDQLMFDMAFELGDTLFQSGYVGDPVAVVTLVDTITISGIKRKKIDLSAVHSGSSIYAESWIDGIGSTKGPSGYLYGVVDWGRVLMCYHKADTLQYIDTAYNTCYWVLGIESEPLLEDLIKVYPNPFLNSFYLEFYDYSNKTLSLRVYDLLGAIRFEADQFYQQTINTEKWPSGVYFLEIEQGSERVLKQLIKR